MASRLAEAHLLAQQRNREATVRAVGAIWRGLGSYDRSDIRRFTEAADPVVEAGQRRAIALGAAFVGKVVEDEPPQIDPEEVIPYIRRGTPKEEVRRRPFKRTWKALKDGKEWSQAVDQGYEIATVTAGMDVTLSMRDGMSIVMLREPRIWGYQRVPDGGACDFCLLASTQRYTRQTLMPLHDRCGCGVEPIKAYGDPGRFFNRDKLKELKAAGVSDEITASRRAKRFADRATSNRGRAAEIRQQARVERNPKRAAVLRGRADSWDERASRQELESLAARADRARQLGKRLAVREHGELGPVLTDASQNFTRL